MSWHHIYYYILHIIFKLIYIKLKKKYFIINVYYEIIEVIVESEFENYYSMYNYVIHHNYRYYNIINKNT